MAPGRPAWGGGLRQCSSKWDPVGVCSPEQGMLCWAIALTPGASLHASSCLARNWHRASVICRLNLETWPPTCRQYPHESWVVAAAACCLHAAGTSVSSLMPYICRAISARPDAHNNVGSVNQAGGTRSRLLHLKQVLSPGNQSAFRGWQRPWRGAGATESALHYALIGSGCTAGSLS